MGVFTENFDQGFAAGIVTATDAPLLDPPASPKGWNTALGFTGQGKPFLQKRLGCALINTTQIPNQSGVSGASSPALINQYDYYRLANATRYHLIYTDDGALFKNVGGTCTELADTLGTGYPDFETASDLCFLTSGTVQKKFDGTNVQKFGIDRPTVGTMSAAAGAAGSHSGTYELRCTFVNTATGHESSASDTASSTVTVTSKKLSWSNIPTTSDTQVDKVYLYVRNTSTMNQFFKVGEVNEGTTTATTDVADSALSELAPDTSENDPPPSDIKFLCYHQGRMFAASETVLYWSKIGKPEAFDPDSFDLVNSADGQAFTGLHSDREILLVFKEDRVYGLFGTDPDSWEFRLLDAETGCVSHRSIQSAGGYVWWWARQGLTRWNGTIDSIGRRTMGDVDGEVTASALARISAAYSEAQGRLVVAVPDYPENSRAERLVVFNVDLGVMESDKWDPMSAASLATIIDANGNQQIVLGGYKGQLFTLWSGSRDGVTQTFEGTFVATASTMGTITTATDWTAVSGDVYERMVTVIDDTTGALITDDVRPYITARTSGGVLTLSDSLAGLIAGRTYRYFIGGPCFQWHSPWLAGTDPWIKKRYRYAFTLTDGPLSDDGSALEIAFDFDEGFSNPRTLNFIDTGTGWGIGLWGTMFWGTSPLQQVRHAVGRVGFVARMRLKSVQPAQTLNVYKLGLQAETQTSKK